MVAASARAEPNRRAFTADCSLPAPMPIPEDLRHLISWAKIEHGWRGAMHTQTPIQTR